MKGEYFSYHALEIARLKTIPISKPKSCKKRSLSKIRIKNALKYLQILEKRRDLVVKQWNQQIRNHVPKIQFKL